MAASFAAKENLVYVRCVRLVWIGSAVALAGCGGIADRAAGTATRDTPVSPSTPDAGSGGEAGASGSPALALPRAVYTGSETSFALFSDGRLASWGRNGSGELGHPGGELFSIRDLGFEPVAADIVWPEPRARPDGQRRWAAKTQPSSQKAAVS